MSNWQRVIALADLPADRPVTVRVNHRSVAVARCAHPEHAHAFDNRCPHRGGQLGDGSISGNDVVCPLHGYDFDLHTGISRFNPEERIAVYPTRITGDDVEVDADAVPPLPDGHDGGYLAPWARPKDGGLRRYEYLQGLASGSAPASAMGTRLPLEPSWDDILLLPGQVARPARLSSEPLSLRTVVGQRAERPLELDVPFLVSHMSFGALSSRAKVALARVASALGTAIGSGEGGMYAPEREAAERYIFEMASGYFGWTPVNVSRADAVEIKFGQSAKAGSGGLLPGSKVQGAIAETRGLEPGTDAHSPARFVDIHSLAELRDRVSEIRDQLGGGPVGIKFAAGRIEEDLDAALEAGADFVTIDGRGGGTGAAPDVLKDNLTIPIQYALARASAHLEKRGHSDVDIVAAGGFRTAADVTKALAMGAAAVALATGALIAVGCQQYLACHSGNCPVGIATQREELIERFDVERSSERGINIFRAFCEEIELLARAIGVADVHELQMEHLATLSSELSIHAGIAHA
jgi:glutamate synthase domain-containing protein 2/nitrite reductase/ring-hydroxylating ferredoxin subunit